MCRSRSARCRWRRDRARFPRYSRSCGRAAARRSPAPKYYRCPPNRSTNALRECRGPQNLLASRAALARRRSFGRAASSRRNDRRPLGRTVSPVRADRAGQEIPSHPWQARKRAPPSPHRPDRSDSPGRMGCFRISSFRKAMRGKLSAIGRANPPQAASMFPPRPTLDAVVSPEANTRRRRQYPIIYHSAWYKISIGPFTSDRQCEKTPHGRHSTVRCYRRRSVLRRLRGGFCAC
jgi:hypothetical protein